MTTKTKVSSEVAASKDTRANYNVSEFHKSSVTHKSGVEVERDTEYQPVTDQVTQPLTIQMKAQDDEEPMIYMHPKSPIPESERRHPTFTSPLVDLQHLGIEYRPCEDTSKNKKTFTIVLEIFATFNDIRFSFAEDLLYLQLLEHLDRKRRIKIKHKATGLDTMRLPYEVLDPSDGRWKVLSIKVLDYSAVLGAKGLKTYAEIVGVPMPDKDTFTKAEKGQMLRMYIERPLEFDEYAKGDCVLHEIRTGAFKLFDNICRLLDIEPLENYGMSTGAIVARIIGAAIAKQAGIQPLTYVDRRTNKTVELKPVARMALSNDGAFPGAIQKLVALGTQHAGNTPYAAMVDGGRAYNATIARIVRGVLADVDIAGCYGNGLRNQLFPIGSPTIYTAQVSLREFVQEFGLNRLSTDRRHKLVPGLWQARISTHKDYQLTFDQTLFVSKVERKFTVWENGITQDDEGFDFASEQELEDGERLYDASMVYPTRELHQAILTHDLYQMASSTWSEQEWREFLDNTFVESAVMYERKFQVNTIDKVEFKGMTNSRKKDSSLDKSKAFFTISLDPILSKLLDERKRVSNAHGKKYPLAQMLKLVINTIYGCIASEYFTSAKDAVSNLVVGNNITARARTVAYGMETYLGTNMSVTDGGVLDVNRIPCYPYGTSSQILSDLYYGESIRAGGAHAITFRPLFERKITLEEAAVIYTDANQHVFTGETVEQVTARYPWANVMTKGDEQTPYLDIDCKLWEHLRNALPKVDVFAKDQFSFETKAMYQELVKHSKVDYRLQKLDSDYTYALRGMGQVEVLDSEGKLKYKNGEVVKTLAPEGKRLFEDICKGDATEYTIIGTELLSLADKRKDAESAKPKYIKLFPHDQITKVTRFLSITPLGCRYNTMAEYKQMIAAYEKAKACENAAEAVANVAYDYGYQN